MDFFNFDANEILEKTSQKYKFSEKWFIKWNELDKDQKKIFEDGSVNFVVTGCAGSGKSIILIHKLYRIFNDDIKAHQSYLIAVYTKALMEFFRDGLNVFLQENNDIEDLFNVKINDKDIINIDRLNLNDFGEKKKYLFVDEYQDIGVSDFKKLIKRAENFMIFGDDEQRLYDDRDFLDIKKLREILGEKIVFHLLKTTYRLPYDIANFAGDIIDSNIREKCHNKDIGANLPKIVECECTGGKDYFKNEIKFIIKEVCDKDLKDVAILIHNRKNARIALNLIMDEVEQVYNEEKKDKKPIISFKTHNDTNNLKFAKEECITLMVFHSSKGTQFQNVFVIKCDEESIWSNKNNYDVALFVACTRASKNLYITHSKTRTKFLDKIKENKYDKYRYLDGKVKNMITYR
ncbi:AAA family ATPase [Peptostreptococcaceae bacterium AGR-M142]